MFIAHRGCWNNYIKENSLDAFINAINDNFYSGFELDIRESYDHEFVVVHDFIYKNHFISKTNINELKKLGLCSLEDVLKLDTDKVILIDIKDDDINIDKFINLITSYNRNIYIMSYSKKVIKNIMEMNSELKVGLLSFFNNNHKEYHFLAVLNNSLDCNSINYFHKKNIVLFFYGIINKINHYDNHNYYIIDDYIKNKIILESNC